MRPTPLLLLLCGCNAVAGLDGLDFATATGAGGAGTASTGQAGDSTSATSSGGAGASGGSSSSNGGAACGDGALDFDESCDDGGTASGDGCGADCQVEGALDTCPAGVRIELAAAIVLGGSTVGNATFMHSACAADNSADAIYEVVPAVSGTLAVDLEGNWSKSMTVRGACNEPFVGECDSNLSGTASLEIDAPVSAMVPLHVHVSGLGTNDAGGFILRLSLR